MTQAAPIKTKIQEDLRQMESGAGRAGSDTLRLWEFYKEQALLWRAIALLQMPATALSIAAALIMFFFADTIITVPQKPMPGIYSVKQLPDEEFIDFATNLANLIGTFQPVTAEKQFRDARKLLWEPALSQFEISVLKDELEVIHSTRRSQIFYVDERLIKVERIPQRDQVIVRLPGVRQKIIGTTALPPEDMAYWIKMSTIPRNRENQYGIVAVDIRAEIKERKEIRTEDKKEKYKDKRDNRVK